MARPRKQTVDYFPHYTGASNGKTLFIVQSRFGNDGYACWFKILELLGSSEGHYYDYSKPSDWQFLLAKTGVSEDILKQLLSALADLRAIDAELYQQKIIWSQNFVDNLASCYGRRKIDFPRKPGVSANNNKVDVNNNHSLRKQKTTNEMKVNEMKVNKESNQRKYGEFQNVLLTNEEHQWLKDKLQDKTDEYIERLSGYLESTGKDKYKSHYATILNWQRRDKESGKAKGRGLPKTYTPTADYPDL